MLILLWLWVVQSTVPPDVPLHLHVVGPQATLRLQWSEYAASMNDANTYLYRAYIEGQKDGVPLTQVGCEGPEVGAGSFHCYAESLPPLVSKPGLYRVTVTAARSQTGPESYPSASAPYNVLYPATQPPNALGVWREP